MRRNPEFIKVKGHIYKLASRRQAVVDPQVSSALTLLESAKGKFKTAVDPDEIMQAKAELAQAAKNLLSSLA